MEKPRTSIDFSKHEITVTNSEGLVIHDLKLKNSYTNSIKFINTCGILAVTGDFGNWIFCREFHPSAKGYVSEGYWCEKLRYASTQECYDYDPEETEKEIKYRIEKGAEEYGYKDYQLNYYIEYLTESLDYIDDELAYTNFAYRECPSFIDSESVIHCKKIKIWLQIIFDGFDYICNEMAKNPELIPAG